MAPSDREFRFLITQANIGNLEKQYAEHGYGYKQAITEKYVQLTDAAVKNSEPVDAIVWPETAFPHEIDMRVPGYGEKIVTEKAAEWKTHLITGGYGYGTSSDEPDKVSNTFFIVEQQGGVQDEPYIKTILLAFGEYIPGAKYFPQIKRWIPAGDFARGPGPTVKQLGDLKIGPQICYESLFPEFAREVADKGAQLFVNLTNDSWYGTWQEPYQHLYMTLARAIEYRRPMVRSTNTGISTVALADGTVLEKSPMDTTWTGRYVVPYKEKPAATFYQLYPWLMDALLIMFTMFIIARAHFDRTSKP